MEVRPSVRAPAQDGRTDGDAEEELLDILDGCELECFAPETALVFENAIERLFLCRQLPYWQCHASAKPRAGKAQTAGRHDPAGGRE